MSRVQVRGKLLLGVALLVGATTAGCGQTSRTEISPDASHAGIVDPTATPTAVPRAAATQPFSPPLPSSAPSPIASDAIDDPAPTLPSLPAGALTTIEAKSHVGKIEVVCGEVVRAIYAKSSNGSPTFLNLDKSKGRFTIVIWKEYQRLFDRAPEILFKGESVCIQGPISLYRGVPQIVSFGGDIAHPSRFLPLTGSAKKCLAKGSAMSILCTILVDEQRLDNQLYLDALDALSEANGYLYDNLDMSSLWDDYIGPEPDIP